MKIELEWKFISEWQARKRINKTCTVRTIEWCGNVMVCSSVCGLCIDENLKNGENRCIWINFVGIIPAILRFFVCALWPCVCACAIVYLCVSVFFSVRILCMFFICVRVSVFVFNPCVRVCFWVCVRQYAKRTFQSRLLITTPRNVIRRCSAVPALCTARPARGLKCHLFGAEKVGGTYFNLAVVAEGKRNWNGCVKVVDCLILF